MPLLSPSKWSPLFSCTGLHSNHVGRVSGSEQELGEGLWIEGRKKARALLTLLPKNLSWGLLVNPYPPLGGDHPGNLGIRAGFEPGLIHLNKILHLSNSPFPHLDS